MPMIEWFLVVLTVVIMKSYFPQHTNPKQGFDKQSSETNRGVAGSSGSSKAFTTEYTHNFRLPEMKPEVEKKYYWFSMTFEGFAIRA